MVIVLIAARYKRLMEWINNRKYEGINGIYIIKIVGPKVFLYIATNLDFETIVDTLKNSIKAQGGLAYVYEFYTIYRPKLKIRCVISILNKKIYQIRN